MNSLTNFVIVTKVFDSDWIKFDQSDIQDLFASRFLNIVFVRDLNAVPGMEKNKNFYFYYDK